MEKIRTLIVGREEPGRTGVLELLETRRTHSGCGHRSVMAEKLVSAYNRILPVDIVFLDVQMPLLGRIRCRCERSRPKTGAPIPIFVTALTSSRHPGLSKQTPPRESRQCN